MSNTEKELDKSFVARPCSGRSISFCTTTLCFSVLSFILSANIASGRIMFIASGIAFLALNITLAIYFAFNKNSKVCVLEDKITQKQFKSAKIIKYDSITGIKVSFSPLIKAPPLVTLYQDEANISFETTSQVYKAFKEACKNDAAIEKLNAALKQKYIHD